MLCRWCCRVLLGALGRMEGWASASSCPSWTCSIMAAIRPPCCSRTPPWQWMMCGATCCCKASGFWCIVETACPVLAGHAADPVGSQSCQVLLPLLPSTSAQNCGHCLPALSLLPACNSRRRCVTVDRLESDHSCQVSRLVSMHHVSSPDPAGYQNGRQQCLIRKAIHLLPHIRFIKNATQRRLSCLADASELHPGRAVPHAAGRSWAGEILQPLSGSEHAIALECPDDT